MTFGFKAFEVDFREACLDGVRLLAKRYNAVPFYAVCVYVDGFDGAFGLYANTGEEFRRTLPKYLADYPEASAEAIHVKALKYNCGDWAYQSFLAPRRF